MKKFLFLLLFSFTAEAFDPSLNMASTHPQFPKIRSDTESVNCLAMMNHTLFDFAPVQFKKFIKALCRVKKGNNR